jgi:hypothetical protein
MRAALHQYLTANCQSIKTWLPPFKATATIQKPYGVISFGENPRNAFNSRTSFQDVTLWLYFVPGAIVALDKAVMEVRRLFRDYNQTGKDIGAKLLQTADGRRFFMEWQQTSKDIYDDDLKAVCKKIEFTIPLGG